MSENVIILNFKSIADKYGLLDEVSKDAENLIKDGVQEELAWELACLDWDIDIY